MSDTSNRYPSILQSFGLVVLFLAVNIVVGLLIIPIIYLDDDLQGLITLASYSLTMLVLAWFALRQSQMPWTEVFGNPPPASPFIYIFIALAVVANIFVVNPIISFIPMPPAVEAFFKEMIKANVGSFVAVVFGAALLEEYVFRGIVLRGFLRNYSPTKAIVVSAAMFGLFHFNPWQFVAAFATGLIMGWLYYRTGSLWPGIFVHFLNNLIGYLGFLLYGDEDILFEATEDVPMALLSILVGLGVLYLIYKILDKRLPQPDDLYGHDA